MKYSTKVQINRLMAREPEIVKILLFEDSPSDRLLVNAELTVDPGLDANISVVEKLVDGLELLRSQHYDLALVDLDLLDSCGTETVERLRAEAPDLPVIVLTGRYDEGLAGDLLRRGVQDFLVKGRLTEKQLPRTVRFAIERHEFAVALDRYARELAASESRIRTIVDLNADAMVIVDSAGTVQFANPAADQMFSSNGPLRTGQQFGVPLAGNQTTEVDVVREDGSAGVAEMRVIPIDWDNCDAKLASLRDITERKRAEAEKFESELRFRQTFELAASGMAHIDKDGTILRANRRLCEMLGYSNDELVGKSHHELVHPDCVFAERLRFTRVNRGDNAPASLEMRYLHKSGATVWAIVTLALAKDEDGRPAYQIAVMEDISEHKADRQKIDRLTRIYAVLSEINGAMIRIHDRDTLFGEACRIAVEMGGFSMMWIGIVDRDGEWIAPVASSNMPRQMAQTHGTNHSIDPAIAPAIEAVRDQGVAFVANKIDSDVRLPMRSEYSACGIRSLAVFPLKEADRVAGILSFYSAEADYFDHDEVRLLNDLAADISFSIGHIEIERKLVYLACHDEPTGLANRFLLLDRLKQFAEICASDKKSFALCIIDIKRFRKVNESLSRMAGNTLLKQFAERLCKAAGDSIYTARIGGDIFALVVPAVSDVMRLALMLESRLKQIIEEPFDLDGTLLKVSTKVGVAMYPADGADGETLIRNAETALKKAKSSVEDYLFYSHDMTIRISESFALERKLRQALDNEEFVLYYQPKVDVETRSVVGIECLVRWLSPDYGLVPPKEFIPLLEETGLILELGAWVLRRAMEDQRKWCEAGIIAPPVAVNVSPMQLRQRAFAGLVEQAIRENAGKARIDLEITESLVMEDIENNIENLTAMRALGIEIAVDDFGTGYSSLAYLARLPVQALKIDRAFVSDMHCDPNAMMLVSTMISLAHSLRLKVIAEGVESEEQAKMLRLLRCEEMQGYLVSEPLPFDDMTILLRKQLEQSGDPVN